MRLIAEPLTVDAFAPFGQVVSTPTGATRSDFSGCLQNGRGGARISLYTTWIAPAPLPLVGRIMERHRYSSQMFLPLDAARYVLVVAPPAPVGDRPDLASARAFVAPGDRGINYAPNVWHHPMAALDRSGLFVVLMWCSGDADDEEFVDLPEPFAVEIA
jgi:ureidoglycolate lyase